MEEFDDNRCGTSPELLWQKLRATSVALCPRPLLFLGPVLQKGMKGWGKLRKKEEVPLSLLEAPLLFGALAFWNTRFTPKDQPRPGAGSLSLRVWAVGVMLGSTVGRLENILQWAKQTPFPTNTHAHTYLHTCMQTCMPWDLSILLLDL